MLSEDRKKELVAALSERLGRHGRSLQCPMCGHGNFTIADAYFMHMLQPDLNSISLGGPSVPALAILCNNCGFMSHHSLGILGLLPSQEKSNG